MHKLFLEGFDAFYYFHIMKKPRKNRGIKIKALKEAWQKVILPKSLSCHL